MWTMTSAREYWLILIMESGAGETLNFPAGIRLPFLPSLFFSTFPSRGPRLATFGPTGPCNFNFAPSLYLSPPSLPLSPSVPSVSSFGQCRSLISISSRKVENIAREYRVTRALATVKPCCLLCALESGGNIGGEGFAWDVCHRVPYCLYNNDSNSPTIYINTFGTL